MFDEDVPLCLSNVDNALVLDSSLADWKAYGNLKMQTAIQKDIICYIGAAVLSKQPRIE